MRIIAGRARGRRLIIPDNPATRPLLEMARGALFNIIGPTIKHAKVLDLYAGSGAIGIEAISRGADEVTFVELDSKAAEVLKDNLERCQLNENAVIKQQPVLQLLKTLKSKYDLIFLDPPFADAENWMESDAGNAIMALTENLLVERGQIIFRLEKSTRNYPSNWGQLSCCKDKTYGRSRICIYRAEI